MNETVLNKKFIKQLLERKNDFKIGEKVNFIYKNDNENIWNLTLRREEKKYSPFIFSLEGKRIGTDETWGRRYTSLEKAILHILNDFNENINIKNKYTNIEEYLNSKIKLIYKYEENDNYYYEDEDGNLYCENGNYNIGDVNLMYCTKDFGEPLGNVKDIERYELINNPKDDPNYLRRKSHQYEYMMLSRLELDCKYFLGNGNGFLGHLYYKDIDKHIAEMKKIYEAFLDQDKPKWISLSDIEKYKEKMEEKLKEHNFEEQDYKYLIKCDLSLNNSVYENQYLLVENYEIPSDLDVDLIGDCCFNCDCEILNKKIISKIYSLEEVKKFCELNKIDIEKNIDKEGNLIIGASRDMIIANDMNRYDKERELEDNIEELEENND